MNTNTLNGGKRLGGIGLLPAAGQAGGASSPTNVPGTRTKRWYPGLAPRPRPRTRPR